MASGSPEHHMDRLGHRLGDRSCNFVLAAEERLGRFLVPRVGQIIYIRACRQDDRNGTGAAAIGDKHRSAEAYR
jgi:predicted RNA-binding Zn-ribbon protein involved in translation (DUF1610 family)